MERLVRDVWVERLVRDVSELGKKCPKYAALSNHYPLFDLAGDSPYSSRHARGYYDLGRNLSQNTSLMSPLNLRLVTRGSIDQARPVAQLRAKYRQRSVYIGPHK